MMSNIWYSYDMEPVFCCFVCLSSFDWNEWSLFPNFGGRFSSSLNFRCDFVECLTVVRSLWLKTERIVLARNRLFVFFIVLTRHALGPISSANLLLFDASRWISSTARLKRWAILNIWIFEWLNEFEAFLGSASNRLANLFTYFVKPSLGVFDLLSLVMVLFGFFDDSYCSTWESFEDFLLLFKFRNSFCDSNCCFCSFEDIFPIGFVLMSICWCDENLIPA